MSYDLNVQLKAQNDKQVIYTVSAGDNSQPLRVQLHNASVATPEGIHLVLLVLDEYVNHINSMLSTQEIKATVVSIDQETIWQLLRSDTILVDMATRLPSLESLPSLTIERFKALREIAGEDLACKDFKEMMIPRRADRLITNRDNRYRSNYHSKNFRK